MARIVRFPKLRPINAVVGLLLASVSTVAVAQPAMLPILAWPGLTQDDLQRMHAAAARLYEGRSIGTIERWRSPESKDAGEAKLIRSFEANGMSCRTVDYTIRFETMRGSPDHYVLNWCQVPGDTWKIVELAPHG
jgi:hypothetical protein